MTDLTSLTAAPVKRARRLHKRAFRRQDGMFLAEGPQAVREALASPGVVTEVLATADIARRFPEFLVAAREQRVTWHVASGAVMAHVCDTVTPQGVVALCRIPATTWADVIAQPLTLVVVMAAVRDPGNAGTVIRVADAAGADAVVCTAASVDPFNPKSVRSSAGSLFHLPVVVGPSAAEVVGDIKGAGLQVVAADGVRGQDLITLRAEGGLSAPTAWLFGNEAWGLPDDLADLADVAAAIPMYGRAESLNLATAAAVCLYASAEAQRVAR